ncbi:MFS transporter [Bacillus sp. ISL-53]|nr:MFS transporter [Bacillus sp. ISL-53]
MHIKMLSPLKIKNFKNLFFAQLLSDLGSWFDFIAINTLIVYTWNLDAGSIAAYAITLGIPSVIIGPLAGVWVDRLPKRLLMVLMDVFRGLIVIGMFFVPNIFYLLPLIFLKSTCTAIFNPARQSALRMILTKDKIAEGISISQFSVQSSKILAPVLGAILVGTFGTKSVFLVEAGLFFISVIFLLKLPVLNSTTLVPNEKEPKRYWINLQESVKYILTKKTLLIATISMAMALFITFMYDGFISLWTKSLGMTESVFGLIVGAIGFGSVLGVVIIGNSSKWKRWPLTMMAYAALSAGALVITMGLGGLGIINVNVFIWFLVFLLIGVSSSFAFVGFGYILQTETEEHMMGRVSAMTTAIQDTAILVSPFIGAFMLKITSVGMVFGGAGILLVLFGLLQIVVSRRIQKIEVLQDELRKLEG